MSEFWLKSMLFFFFNVPLCTCIIASSYQDIIMCLFPPFSSPADREVQRILLELLNQMDGFDQNVNVKVGLKP